MARIVYRNGPLAAQVVDLQKEITGLGRMPDNDVELKDSLVSRRHTQVLKSPGGFILKDLGSSNGTYLNNRRISGEERLASGDEILIGDTLFVFEDGPPSVPGVTDSQIVDQIYGASPDDVVRRVDDISEDFRIDLRQSIAKGLSLRDLRSKVEAKPKKKPQKEVPVPAEEAEERRDRFFLLYQVGKAVTSATDLDEMLHVALASIFDVIHAERGVVMLQDPKTTELTTRIQRRRDGSVEQIHASRAITNKVIREKVSIITNDAKHDSRFDAGMSIVQYNIRSALCVPLWVQQEVLGVIYVDNLLKTYAFTDSDLELLTAIANLVAIRIKQEELHDNLTRAAVIRSNLEKYHSPDMVKMILEKTGKGEGLGMDVEEREVTIVFADIRGFTNLSETIPPAAVAKVLNGYYETLAQVIFEHGGSINKYMGDAVMALFGAPLAIENHALKAVQCAIKILEQMDGLRARSEHGQSFDIRIGINTGTVIAGNVGSERMIEYTVIGDVVNVASRLEKLARPNTAAIGEETYLRVQHTIKARDMGRQKLRGRKEETGIFEVPAS